MVISELFTMNKIYSLKYCHITNTIKVVSELARRVCKGSA
ncbi:ESPR-type extended signal peptide-containing protein, partial [Escherichia albertii]